MLDRFEMIVNMEENAKIIKIIKMENVLIMTLPHLDGIIIQDISDRHCGFTLY